MNKLAAETFGTFWLVLGGCGSAVLAAGFPEVGIGLMGVALAFGLTVLTMAYAVGGISGGHFNPAVSFGLAVAGKFAWRDFLPYVIAQVIGGALGALVLYLIVSGKADFAGTGGFASNGYAGFAPISIGLGLTLIHLISIPVTNTSVNPARSLAVALFADGWALQQVWLFWLAPLAGAAIGAVLWKMLLSSTDE